MYRRSLLAVVIAGIAGCVGGPAAESDTTASSTATRSSTPDPLPAVSTPTGDCEPVDLPSSPVSYPDLPESATAAAAREFVVAFEEASGAGEIEARGDDYSGFDGGDATVRERTDDGLLLRTWVGLDFTTDDAAGSARTTAWYYVTPDFAVRAPASGGVSGQDEEVPEEGWETVACAPERSR